MNYPKGIKVAAWARAERRRELKKERRRHVRRTFAFLFGLAVLVFTYSDHRAFQDWIYTEVGPTLEHWQENSDLKMAAFSHERDVNETLTK